MLSWRVSGCLGAGLFFDLIEVFDRSLNDPGAMVFGGHFGASQNLRRIGARQAIKGEEIIGMSILLCPLGELPSRHFDEGSIHDGLGRSGTGYDRRSEGIGMAVQADDFGWWSCCSLSQGFG